MTTQMRVLFVVPVLAALAGLLYWSGPSLAGGDDLPKTVQKIAAALKKGDAAGAKKLTAATAKNEKLIDEISDLMHMFRPASKGGLEIENRLKKPSAKDAEDLGNLVIAMSDLSAAKGWPKDAGKRNKKAWNEFSMEMRAAGEDLAKAKTEAAVKAAATKANNSCTRCHSVFKD